MPFIEFDKMIYYNNECNAMFTLVFNYNLLMLSDPDAEQWATQQTTVISVQIWTNQKHSFFSIL